ncbi:MAG: hypothetical protein J6Q15_02620, partial [Clostridia bacterium]|nr:hypothetical protein [Clostridia bacterium]
MAHFFLGGKSVIVAVVVFFCVFVGLSMYFLYVKNKYSINTLTKLNKLAFGKYYEIGNMLLIIVFIVTSSAMLAGCDNLAKNYLELNFPIISIFLSIVTFFIVIGGVNRIKTISGILTPILIAIITINGCFNLGRSFTISGNASLDIVSPIIFCCENFITLISVLLATKSKPKVLSLISGVVISILILMSTLAIGNLNADMPMLYLSKNISNIFFAIYLIGVIFALFT